MYSIELPTIWGLNLVNDVIEPSYFLRLEWPLVLVTKWVESPKNNFTMKLYVVFLFCSLGWLHRPESFIPPKPP